MPFLAAIPAAAGIGGGAAAAGAGAAGAGAAGAGAAGGLSAIMPSLVTGATGALGAGASAKAAALRDEDARAAQMQNDVLSLINNYGTIAGKKNAMESDAISTILSRIRG